MNEAKKGGMTFGAAGGFQRGCSEGPALKMWKPSHTEPVTTYHYSRVLRERKNGKLTTKVAN